MSSRSYAGSALAEPTWHNLQHSRGSGPNRYTTLDMHVVCSLGLLTTGFTVYGRRTSLKGWSIPPLACQDLQGRAVVVGLATAAEVDAQFAGRCDVHVLKGIKDFDAGAERASPEPRSPASRNANGRDTDASASPRQRRAAVTILPTVIIASGSSSSNHNHKRRQQRPQKPQ